MRTYIKKITFQDHTCAETVAVTITTNNEFEDHTKILQINNNGHSYCQIHHTSTPFKEVINWWPQTTPTHTETIPIINTNIFASICSIHNSNTDRSIHQLISRPGKIHQPSTTSMEYKQPKKMKIQIQMKMNTVTIMNSKMHKEKHSLTEIWTLSAKISFCVGLVFIIFTIYTSII